MAFQKTSHLESTPAERNYVRIKFPSTCLLLRQLCDQLASLYSPSLYNVSVMVSNHTLLHFPIIPNAKERICVVLCSPMEEQILLIWRKLIGMQLTQLGGDFADLCPFQLGNDSQRL